MFEVSFSQASRQVEFFPWRRLNSFFFLVSSLLRLVQWFVWALCRVRFALSFFCCLFVFPLMGKAEWGGTPVLWWLDLYFCLFLPWWKRPSDVVILSAEDWVYIFILLFRWGVLHRVLLVVGWCWVLVLYSSGFLFGSSHYLIPPRVSSLAV